MGLNKLRAPELGMASRVRVSDVPTSRQPLYVPIFLRVAPLTSSSRATSRAVAAADKAGPHAVDIPASAVAVPPGLAPRVLPRPPRTIGAIEAGLLRVSPAPTAEVPHKAPYSAAVDNVAVPTTRRRQGPVPVSKGSPTAAPPCTG